MNSLFPILITGGTIVVVLAILMVTLAQLYRRSTKERAFVRTGLGGQKVIKDGGALVLPVLHEVIDVNMTTLKLTVSRRGKSSLITADRMRVDVDAEFYVRVNPKEESIAAAAQTLGNKTMNTKELSDLIEGKLVDSLRSVAASMDMNALHEQRKEFVQKVMEVVSQDIDKNGLELESVSLTSLDQTNKNDLDPNNAFDAVGLAKLTRIIEENRKLRNDVERETEVLIEAKNLATSQQTQKIRKDKEFIAISTDQEIANRRAQQMADIAKVESEQNFTAEQARLGSERQVEEQRIDKDEAVRRRQVEMEKSISLAEQDRQIAVADRSKDESRARAEAETARALAVTAEESVTTARELAMADRRKSIELVRASEEAEKQATGVTVAARAEREAATERAEAMRVEAEATSNSDKIRADGVLARLNAEAEGARKINEAANSLSPAQVDLRFREALLVALPEIMKQTLAPIGAIDSIKIVDVNGFGQGGNGHGHGGEGSQGGDSSLPDQAVNAALRHRVNAPFVDSILSAVGMDARSIAGLTAPLQRSLEKPIAQAEAAAEESHAD